MLAPKSETIKVTREIIDESLPNSQVHCMVANATRQSIPGAWSVHVTSDTIWFNLGGDHRGGDSTRFCYQTPGRVGVEVKRFDDLYEKYGPEGVKRIKPFSFRLDKRSATYAPVIRRGPRDKPYRARVHKGRQKTIQRCTVRRHAGLVVASR
jgi:hypothetical protein